MQWRLGTDRDIAQAWASLIGGVDFPAIVDVERGGTLEGQVSGFCRVGSLGKSVPAYSQTAVLQLFRLEASPSFGPTVRFRRRMTSHLLLE